MLDPVAFYVGSWPVRWYGLAYLATFLSSLYWAKSFSKYTIFSSKNLDALLNYIVFGTICGGRIGDFLFYNHKFSSEIFYIWHGGQSFHGGVLGVAVSILLFAKIYKKNVLAIADLVSLFVPIGCFLGRIANFINQELPGKIIAHDFFNLHRFNLHRHPVVLYEAFAEGLILLILLHHKKIQKLKIHGKICSDFLIWYGIFRFLLEFFKEPSSLIFNTLSMGQVLSIPMIVGGLIIKRIY